MLQAWQRESELTPGELAPGLYYAAPEELTELLETGDHLDLQDFRNACLDLRIDTRNASRAFRPTVGYLAVHLYDKTIGRQLHDALDWNMGTNPNMLGIRDRLLVGTQHIADMVESCEAGTFNDPDHWFTPTNWRVIRATVRGEFDISFERRGRETFAVRTRITQL